MKPICLRGFFAFAASIAILPFFAVVDAAENPPANDTGANPAATNYTLKLSPHFATDGVFSYQATASQARSNRTTHYKMEAVNGVPSLSHNLVDDKRENLDLELVAQDVLARGVFPNGSLSEADFVVTRCNIFGADGKAQVVVPAGAIIGARKLSDGSVAFAVDGKTPSPELAANLSLLIQLGDAHFTDDDMFGPPGPVAQDDAWKVNSDNITKSDFVEDFRGILLASGNFHLDGVKHDANGLPIATVSGRVALDGVLPQFPSDAIAGPSQVSFQLRFVGPLDAATGTHQGHLTSLVHYEARIGDVKQGEEETDRVIETVVTRDNQYVLNPSRKPSAALASPPPVPDPPPAQAAAAGSVKLFTPPQQSQVPTMTPAPTTLPPPIQVPRPQDTNALPPLQLPQQQDSPAPPPPITRPR